MQSWSLCWIGRWSVKADEYICLLIAVLWDKLEFDRDRAWLWQGNSQRTDILPKIHSSISRDQNPRNLSINRHTLDLGAPGLDWVVLNIGLKLGFRGISGVDILLVQIQNEINLLNHRVEVNKIKETESLEPVPVFQEEVGWD